MQPGRDGFGVFARTRAPSSDDFPSHANLRWQPLQTRPASASPLHFVGSLGQRTAHRDCFSDTRVNLGGETGLRRDADRIRADQAERLQLRK